MNYAYLIGDADTSVCAAVDPGWKAEKIKSIADELGWKIEKILLTHAHFDHANSLMDLVGLTGAPVYLHKDEPCEIPRSISTSTTEDGSVIDIGTLKVRCLHTPGHTQGSQCFLIGNAVITGDTLFVDGCGRVDLPGSDPKEMLVSLHRLAGLAPEIIVYPGHNYGHAPTSTIGEQLEMNPYLKANSEDMLL